MAKFKKGQSGNPSGRGKGAKGRTTEQVRQILLKILDDNLDSLRSDLKGMKGKDRATILISLAKHLTPPALSIDKLTEDQMQQIIDYLKQQQNEQNSI